MDNNNHKQSKPDKDKGPMLAKHNYIIQVCSIYSEDGLRNPKHVKIKIDCLEIDDSGYINIFFYELFINVL